MMTHPRIQDAPRFALPPRCHAHRDGEGCRAPATVWLVEAGDAISTYCRPCADEFLRAVALLGEDFGEWTTAPVVMAEGVAA